MAFRERVYASLEQMQVDLDAVAAQDPRALRHSGDAGVETRFLSRGRIPEAAEQTGGQETHDDLTGGEDAIRGKCRPWSS